MTRVRSAMASRWLWSSIAAALVVLAAAPAHAQGPVAADDVRAAFVFNFAKFTEWPPDSFASADEPLVVCFAGGSGVAEAFLRFGQKSVQNRALIVRQDVPVRETPGCHVLYVDSADAVFAAPLLAAARMHSVLTVSHARGFAVAGGMIGLVQVGSRVQFEVNIDEAGREKIRLSSHVLQLARIVRTGGN